jgi:cyclase
MLARIGLTLAAAAALGSFLLAQAPAGQGAAPAGAGQAGAAPAARGPAPFRTTAIKEGKVYWVAGGGGNSGVIIGQNGVIVIDAKTTPDGAKQLIAEVAKLTPKPITNVIITHSDGDHVNGLPAFPATTTIIAHVNNRLEQRATFQYAAVEVDGGRCLPPADRLPNKVIMQSRVATRIEGVNIVFHHFGPAHTSGDLVVQLPDDRVAFTGDLLTNNVLVHPIKNGSLDGWFTTAKGLIALDVDSYVGGHSNALDTKETLQKRMADYQALRDKVEALVKEGKPLPEIKTAMGDPTQAPSGCRGIPYLTFTELAYHAYMDKAQEVR